MVQILLLDLEPLAASVGCVVCLGSHLSFAHVFEIRSHRLFGYAEAGRTIRAVVDSCLRRGHYIFDDLTSFVRDAVQRGVVDDICQLAVNYVLRLELDGFGIANNCFDRPEAKIVRDQGLPHEGVGQTLYRDDFLGKLLSTDETCAI